MRFVLMVLALGILEASLAGSAGAQEAQRPIVFVLDASRSMNNEGRMDGAIAAAQLGVALTPRDSEVSALVFAYNACFLAKGESLAGRRFLEARLEDPTDRSNLLDGCRIRTASTEYLEALDALASLGITGGLDAVFLTDGEPKDRSRDDIVPRAEALSQQGVRFFTISLGSEVGAEGEEILSRMAQASGGAYRRAPRTEDVVDVYARILEEIAGLYRFPVKEGQSIPLPIGASRLIFLLLRTDPGPPTQASILHDGERMTPNRRFPPAKAPPGLFTPKAFDVLDVDAPAEGTYSLVGLEDSVDKAYAFANLPFEIQVRQQAPAEEHYEGEDIPFEVEIAAPEDSAWAMLRDAPATVDAVLLRGDQEEERFSLEEVGTAGPSRLRRFAATRRLTLRGAEPENWSVRFLARVPIGDVTWQRELRRDFRLLGMVPFTVHILEGEPAREHTTGETVPFGAEITASNPDAWSVLQGASSPVVVALLRDGVPQDEATVLLAESRRDGTRQAVTFEGTRLLSLAGTAAENWTAAFDIQLGSPPMSYHKSVRRDFVLRPPPAAKPPAVDPSRLRILTASGAAVTAGVAVRDPNDPGEAPRRLCVRSDRGDVRLAREVAIPAGSESSVGLVWEVPEIPTTTSLSRTVALAWCDDPQGAETAVELEACVLSSRDWPPSSPPWRAEPGSGTQRRPLPVPANPCGIEVHPRTGTIRLEGPGGASLDGVIREGQITVVVSEGTVIGSYGGGYALASDEAVVVGLEEVPIRLDVVEPTEFSVDPARIRWNAAEGKRQKAEVRMTLARAPGTMVLAIDPPALVRAADGATIGREYLRFAWKGEPPAQDLPLEGTIEPGTTKVLEIEVWIPSDHGRGVFQGSFDIGLYRKGGEPVPVSSVSLEVTVP